MALLWMDGFDHYDLDSGNMADGSYSIVSSVFLSGTNTRTGAGALYASSNSGYIQKTLPSSASTVGIGAGFYVPSIALSFASIFDFLDSGGGTQATLFLMLDGSLRLVRGFNSGSNILAESDADLFSAGSWQHIECKVEFDNSAGSCEIRLNGIAVASAAGIDTQATANDGCGIVRIHPDLRSNSSSRMDDLFIWDGSGSTNNDFLGDRKVVTLDPNDNTSTAEWTATGAATGVQAINTTNDGDTSYINASDSVPVTSEFELENPDGTVGAIAGVMSVVVSRKVESGTAIVAQDMVVSGSSTGTTGKSIGDTYAYYNEVHETNPATGLPWSSAALASARLRLRRTT